MKRNNRLAISLLSWTLAALLLSAQASAAPEEETVGSSETAETAEPAVSVKALSGAASESTEPAAPVPTEEAVEGEEPTAPVPSGEAVEGEEPTAPVPSGEAVEGEEPTARAAAETTEAEVPETGTTETEAFAETHDTDIPDAETAEEETAELQGLFWKSSRHLSVTQEDWRLGQSPRQPAVDGRVEDAPLICVYRDADGVIIPDIAAAPAGTYTITVFVEETEDYAAASARAEFSITPSYTVAWVNADGSLLEKDEFVEPGTVPHYDGEEPARAATPAYSYSFRGWDPELDADSAVTGDITYTAVYTETLNQYNVDFLDDDGTALKHAVYSYGARAEDIVRPDAPKKGLTSQYAFTFRGWTPEISDVTGNAVYTAVYDKSPVAIYHPREDAKSSFTALTEPCQGGTVRVLPDQARPGTPVLLTPVPDSGNVLDVLIVRGLGRTETLALSRNGDKYTFTMPSFDVSVTASFLKLDTAGGMYTEKQNPAAADNQNTSDDTELNDTDTGRSAAETAENPAIPDRIVEQDSENAKMGQTGGRDDRPEVVQYSLVKTGFYDVSASAYYSKAVQWAARENVLPGVSETAFAPDSPCTRAQMVLALWRASGSPSPARGCGNPFSDVDVNSPYYEAVLWAMENCVTRGTTSTTFSPDRPVSRAQAVTLLYRLQGYQAKRANPFSDSAQGQYFYEAALWACAAGITRGTTASTFSPHAPCSRAQAAAFLYRAFQG